VRNNRKLIWINQLTLQVRFLVDCTNGYIYGTQLFAIGTYCEKNFLCELVAVYQLCLSQGYCSKHSKKLEADGTPRKLTSSTPKKHSEMTEEEKKAAKARKSVCIQRLCLGLFIMRCSDVHLLQNTSFYFALVACSRVINCDPFMVLLNFIISSEQVVHTHMLLSPSSVIWYWPKSGDTVFASKLLIDHQLASRSRN